MTTLKNLEEIILRAVADRNRMCDRELLSSSAIAAYRSSCDSIIREHETIQELIRVIELAGVALQQVNDKSLCVPAIVQDVLAEIRKLKGQYK